MCRSEVLSSTCNHTTTQYNHCRLYHRNAKARSSLRRKILHILRLKRTRVITQFNCPAPIIHIVTSRLCDRCVRDTGTEKDENKDDAKKRDVQIPTPPKATPARTQVQAPIPKAVTERPVTPTPTPTRHPRSFNVVQNGAVCSNAGVHKQPRDVKEQIDKRIQKDRHEYLCIGCLHEHRNPSPRERAANSGFCCAGGVDEWEVEFGPLKGERRRSNLDFGGRGVSPSSRPHDVMEASATYVPRGGENLFPEEVHTQSIPRDTATYVTSPGEHLFPDPISNSRGSVPAKDFGLGIKMDGWNSTIQTGHGTIPPPPWWDLPKAPLSRTTEKGNFTVRPHPPTPSVIPTSKVKRSGGSPFWPYRIEQAGSSRLRSRLPVAVPTRIPAISIPFGLQSMDREHTESGGPAALTRSGAPRGTNTVAANYRQFRERRPRSPPTLTRAAPEHPFSTSGKSIPRKPLPPTSGTLNNASRRQQIPIAGSPIPPRGSSRQGQPRQPQLSSSPLPLSIMPNHSISLVSTNNTHWDAVLPSPPTEPNSNLNGSVSPFEQIQPIVSQRTQSEAQSIQMNRQPQSVISRLEFGIDETLAVWEGPQAMTRQERIEMEMREARERGFENFKW